MTTAELIWELSKYDKSHTVVTFNPHTGNWDNPTGVSGILGEGAVHMRNDGEWPIEANKKITNEGIQFIPCEAVYIKEDKPTKKVIDLSVLIDSQIDCEFKYGGSLTPKAWFIDKLTEIHNEANTYKPSLQGYTTYCRPRMNHIHAWQGGECPLPEGFMVKVWWRGGLFEVRQGDLFQWGIQKNSSRDIIAFEVLGLADGYVMPWGSE